jgi:hypothetical protein
MGPRVRLHDVEKTEFYIPPGLELRPLCRPARSQSLYRLRYPSSHYEHIVGYIMDAAWRVPREKPARLSN